MVETLVLTKFSYAFFALRISLQLQVGHTSGYL